MSLLLRLERLANASSMNAPILVEPQGKTDPLEIAELELESNKIPLKVRRYLPDGSFEDWAVCELLQARTVKSVYKA